MRQSGQGSWVGLGLMERWVAAVRAAVAGHGNNGAQAGRGGAQSAAHQRRALGQIGPGNRDAQVLRRVRSGFTGSGSMHNARGWRAGCGIPLEVPLP